MNTIEFVVTFKTEPHERQQSVVYSNETAATNFAYGIESDGGMAVITRRIKHIARGQTFTDAGQDIL